MAIPIDVFRLDPARGGTLQTQIRGMVAEAILAGHLRPGERMPSSRRLAAHLGVSRITVTLAYGELVAEDYLTARGRSGYFISETAPRPRPRFTPHRTAADAEPAERVDWTRALGARQGRGLGIRKPLNWRDFRYPFVYGQADPALFDHVNWRACTMMALGQRHFHSLTDDSFERDDEGLVDYIARHTLPRRGILARPEEILITLGAQNALWLAAQLLLNQRRTAAIEVPGYPGLHDILGQTRCRVQAVPVGGDGLEPGLLPEGTDVLFCTPSHHCPTGAAMPMAARRALLARAATEDFLIVEDDYEFHIDETGRPLPALKSLDGAGRVIHVGSFSKSLFPGLRLGFMVGAEAFIREARALRATVLRHPPGLTQRAAAYYLSLGHYDSLLRRIGRVYAERRRLMRAAVAEHGLTVAGREDGGGSSLWMRAPEGTDCTALAGLLRHRSVLIEPGQPFFGDGEDAPRHFYRIAFSSIAAERIPEGMRRLAEAMG